MGKGTITDLTGSNDVSDKMEGLMDDGLSDDDDEEEEEGGNDEMPFDEEAVSFSEDEGLKLFSYYFKYLTFEFHQFCSRTSLSCKTFSELLWKKSKL